MSRYRLHYVIFLIGLAVLCWVGAGYLSQAGSSPLAFLMTVVIAACYVGGAFELHRYRRDTRALAQRVAALQAAPTALDEWLAPLPSSLRHAVRTRIEGERTALPGPVLTPYLVGLLVLLGMLGTLLGMVVTLRGTGAAMANAADIDAIRASLGAPIKGLGFAFGTSIAGVSASAMLGLLAALCRRERLQTVQALDGRIAGTLRVFSQRHQRDTSLQLLQRQADVMPALVSRLEATMAAIEQQHLEAQKRQAAQQQTFHSHTERVYLELARSVGEAMRHSVAEGAQAASAALQPVAQATFDSIGREMRELQRTVGEAVQHQLAGLTDGFSKSTTDVATLWQDALHAHTQAGADQAMQLRDALTHFTTGFEARAREMHDTLAQQYETSVRTAAQAWRDTIAEQARAGDQLAERHEKSLVDASAAFTDGAHALLEGLGGAHTALRTQLADDEKARLDAWHTRLEATTDALRGQWTQTAAQDAARLEAWHDRMESSADLLRALWAQSTEQDIARLEAWRAHTEAAAETLREQAMHAAGQDTARLDAWRGQMDAVAASLRKHADAAAEQDSARLDAWRAQMDAIAETMRAHVASGADQDTARLDAWRANMDAASERLRVQWAHSAEETTQRHQAICDALSDTATTISAQSAEHARSVIAEISTLAAAAAEAPKAAAAVIGEMREQLSESVARDTATLDERARLLDTLQTLLHGVNLAATEQRTAIDTLVGRSSDLLTRIAAEFAQRVADESGKLDGIAANISSGAADVSSLAEAMTHAVAQFDAANGTLVTHLERVEGALDKSMSRSDEQLGFYVAQAREVIDLSMLSQKQIIENLQHLSAQRGHDVRGTAAGAAAA